jgi:probable HAF family extracellular repeat protein
VSIHAFRSSATGLPVSLTDLGSLGTNSFATGINSTGMVIGYYMDAVGNPRAFLYDTQMRDLTFLAGRWFWRSASVCLWD